MTNLGLYAHRLAEIVNGNPIHALGKQRSREQILSTADDDLPLVAANLDHIKRRPGGDAQSLALADGEVVNSAVRANDLARRGN
jgi:hypothetical protein